MASMKGHDTKNNTRRTTQHKKRNNLERGHAAEVSDISSRSPSTPLLFGAEGGHISQAFAPATGTKLDAKSYGQLLERSSALRDTRPAIYIHLPFCPSRCLSCDRHSVVTHTESSIDDYIDDLDREMELYAARLGEGTELAQIHLGGGTPNYLSEPQMLRLMSVIERYFKIVPETEMSLEANPKRCSYAQLQLLYGLGFRDIKLQVRDLDAEVQLAIGRTNSAAILEDVCANIRDIGFSVLSVDLVYGLPEQTTASITRTVQQLKALSPNRVTCSGFNRQANRFMHQRALPFTRVPSLADGLILFNAVINSMEVDGYEWVGLESFMRADDRLAVAQHEQRLHRNWIGYNLHGSPTVLGFGASAISEVGNGCVQNHNDVDAWRDTLRRGELPVRGGVLLNEREQAYRRAVNDLFCNMQLDSAESLCVSNEHQDELDSLRKQGVVDIRDDRLAITQEGRILLHHACSHAKREYSWAGGW